VVDERTAPGCSSTALVNAPSVAEELGLDQVRRIAAQLTAWN